jgi:hypothetical protein
MKMEFMQPGLPPELIAAREAAKKAEETPKMEKPKKEKPVAKPKKPAKKKRW